MTDGDEPCDGSFATVVVACAFERVTFLEDDMQTRSKATTFLYEPLANVTDDDLITMSKLFHTGIRDGDLYISRPAN